MQTRDLVSGLKNLGLITKCHNLLQFLSGEGIPRMQVFKKKHRPGMVFFLSDSVFKVLRSIRGVSCVLCPFLCMACKTTLGDTSMSKRSLHPKPAADSDQNDQEGDPSTQAESSSKISKSSDQFQEKSVKKFVPVKNATLTWRQTIDANALGIDPSSKAVGNSIEAIITSKVAGRDDGIPCGTCHNQKNPMGGYGLNQDSQGAGDSLDPWASVGTKNKHTWAGEDGWGVRFIRNKTKPESLKAIMKAWANSGYK